MTQRAGMWLACALGLSVVGANVAIKPGLARVETRRVADVARRSREWRGREAPMVTLPLLEGGTVSAGGPADDVTLLLFMTSWCEDDCRYDLEELQRYTTALTTTGARVRLAVIDVQEPADVVRAFARRHQVTAPLALDTAGDVMRAYDVRTFPTTVIVGRDGRVLLYQERSLLNADVALDRVVLPALEAGAEPRP